MPTLFAAVNDDVDEGMSVNVDDDDGDEDDDYGAVYSPFLLLNCVQL